MGLIATISLTKDKLRPYSRGGGGWGGGGGGRCIIISVDVAHIYRSMKNSALPVQCSVPRSLTCRA